MEKEELVTLPEVVDLTTDDEKSSPSVRVSNDRTFKSAGIVILATTNEARYEMVNLINQYIKSKDPSVTRFSEPSNDRSQIIVPSSSWGTVTNTVILPKIASKVGEIMFRLYSTDAFPDDHFSWNRFKKSANEINEDISAWYPYSLILALDLSNKRTLNELAGTRGGPQGVTIFQELKTMIDNNKFSSVTIVGIKQTGKPIILKEKIYKDTTERLGLPRETPHYTISEIANFKTSEMIETTLEAGIFGALKSRSKQNGKPRKVIDEPTKRDESGCDIM